MVGCDSPIIRRELVEWGVESAIAVGQKHITAALPFAVEIIRKITLVAFVDAHDSGTKLVWVHPTGTAASRAGRRHMQRTEPGNVVVNGLEWWIVTERPRNEAELLTQLQRWQANFTI